MRQPNPTGPKGGAGAATAGGGGGWAGGGFWTSSSSSRHGAGPSPAAAEEGDAFGALGGLFKGVGVRTGLVADTTAPPTDIKDASYMDEFSELASLTVQQRLYGFLLSLLMGIVFTWIAMGFVPTIALFPKKFAFFFTCGNFFIVVAPSFLVGPRRQLETMMQAHRAQAAGTYIAATCLTLFSALHIQSSVLSIVFACVQIAAVISYGLSFIPFARQVVSVAMRNLSVVLKPLATTVWKVGGLCCACMCRSASS